jgi:hypothetical protein
MMVEKLRFKNIVIASKKRREILEENPLQLFNLSTTKGLFYLVYEADTADIIAKILYLVRIGNDLRPLLSVSPP